MTTLLRTDFDDFLLAPIADDANGMSLTLLSALARLGLDPWAEAANLAGLSRDSATQKLIALLAGVTNGPLSGADTASVASRLVALLHAPVKPRSPVTGAASPPAAVLAQARRVRLAIYYLLALILVLVGYSALSSRHEPSPPDSSVPESR